MIHVPGYNPSKHAFDSLTGYIDAATLAGTNCFVIGTGEERVMIDAGDDVPINDKFVGNLGLLMKEKRFRLKVSFCLGPTLMIIGRGDQPCYP